MPSRSSFILAGVLAWLAAAAGALAAPPPNDARVAADPGSEGTVANLQAGTTYPMCLSVNYTSSSHPDESAQACIDAATSGTAPTPTPTASPTPTPPPTEHWKWDARNAPLDPDSAQYMAEFQTYAISRPNLAMTCWAVSTVDATDSDPTYSIPRVKQGGSISIRIPIGARPDPCGDGHLTVRDAGNGIETDFYEAVYDSTTGRISQTGAAVSFPLGVPNEQTSGWGGNAANTPLRLGLVTPEAIQTGRIGETMQFSTPQVGGTRDSYRWPALHNAPTCNDGNCEWHLSVGSWVRLDPAVDVDALSIPTWQKVIAKAMQDHGMILRDTGGTLAIYGRNPNNGEQQWSTIGLTGSSASFSSEFPWNRLQLLQPPGP